MLTGRAADKLTFTAIYLAVAVLVVWGAGRLVNFAIDVGFYRDYLSPWELCLVEMRYKPVKWPPFTQDHPVGYMQSVVGLMKANGLHLPRSNTRHDFIYRLAKFGADAAPLLLVLHANRIDIFGLPRTTFDRLDRFIDGRMDPGDGDFTGRLSRDQITMIGAWRI